MTGYFGRTITYDTIGNPLTDGTWTYTWQNGRELASMTDGATTWTYTYDANGMRKTRSNGTDTYTYLYNGSLLVQMQKNDTDTLHFYYDANGIPVAVDHNGTMYYYTTSLQGDVIGILNTSGTVVVEYAYDAWGNLIETSGTMATTLGVLNPLTYRSYTYDHETSLYYLQTRYYIPTIERFINADVYVSTGQGMLGNNMFAYCRNNPVSRIDVSGTEDVSVEEKNENGNVFDDIGNPTGSGGGSVGSSGGGNGNGNNISGGQSSPSTNASKGYNTGHSIGTGQAPKQGTSGSTYTQVSSDGKGQTVSVTTYGAYDRPFTRVDYIGRDHHVGLPHIHRFDWGFYNGGIRQIGETITPYIKE